MTGVSLEQAQAFFRSGFKADDSYASFSILFVTFSLQCRQVIKATDITVIDIDLWHLTAARVFLHLLPMLEGIGNDFSIAGIWLK